MKTRRFFGQVLVLVLLATLSKPVERSKENHVGHRQVCPTIMAAMNIYRNGAYANYTVYAAGNTSAQSSSASATTQEATGFEVTADSCSQEDIQAAVDEVEAADGGTVYIPAGDCTWNGAGIHIRGDVSIIGAGQDNTKLYLYPDSATRWFFKWNEYSGHSTFVRLSGIGFYANDRKSSEGDGTATDSINLKRVDNYRIDNCYFEGIYNHAITWKYTPKGVVDHCTFKRTLSGDSLNGATYGLHPGSPYAPYDLMPPVCDLEVCKCEVGARAKDRRYAHPSGYTIILRLDDDKNSAAAVIDNAGGSGTGIVQRLYIQIAEAETAATVDIAAFETVGSNSFSTRGVAQGIPVVAGRNILKAGMDFGSININDDDYIGVYLHNCTIDMDNDPWTTDGDEAWVLQGDKIPCTDEDFGEPSIGEVSIYAEIFDSEGEMAQCESDWDHWYSLGDERNGLFFDKDWLPGSDKAHYIEDCTFYWHRSAMCANWGNLNAVVFRHNYFVAPSSIGNHRFLGIKPGTIFGVFHDNIFERQGDQIGGAFNMRVSGLIYDNIFRNLRLAGYFEQYRHFSDYYFTEQIRMKELYIFNNTYKDCGCTEDGSDCWQYTTGNKAFSWVGEDFSYFFRPPQPGERLYNFSEYTYPHPLVTDTTPPSRASGSPTGTLSSGTTQTTLSLTTNESATCRYSTTPNTAYASMPNTFTTTGGIPHSTTVSGLSDGNSYAYYVRCQDTSGNANPDDYSITFSVAEPLVLHGAPADQAIRLSWTVETTLPATSTWQIAYDGPTGDQPSPISGIVSPTRAYTLTGLTNYTWYTVTLGAMLDGTPLLTGTVRVMPTGISVYLPLVLKGQSISSVSSSSITQNSAVITWTTDEPSTLRVEYGQTTSYGSQTIEDTNESGLSNVALETTSVDVGFEVTAESCSSDDINTAVDLAEAAGGGTVYIPAGTCDMTSMITIQSSPGNVSIIGAGQDNTHLVNASGGDYIFQIRGPNCRISGIHLAGSKGRAINLRTDNCINFRVDNCYFEDFGIAVSHGATAGVIDHCTFRMTYNYRSPSSYPHGAVYISGDDDIWTSDVTQIFGSANAVFIEDCSFPIGSGSPSNPDWDSFSCNVGVSGGGDEGHYVFRHNTCEGSITKACDVHGPTVGGMTIGGRCMEVYGNSFIKNGEEDNCAIYPRGGSGVVYNNTIVNHDWAYLLIIEGSDRGTYPDDYPGTYQIQDFYIWNNTVENCSHELGHGFSGSDPVDMSFIQEDRDYFLRAPTQALDGFTYTPYTYPHPLVTGEQNVYYVTKDGKDSNPGSESRPWLTIQKAADTIEAGDTVYIKEGVYYEIVNVQNSGLSGNYVTFKAYSGHNVILDGTGNAGWHGIFGINGKDYIKLEDIEIRNNNIGWGVLIQHNGAEDSSNIELSGLNIHHTGGESIQIRGGSNNITVRNCEVHDGDTYAGIDAYTNDGRRPHHITVIDCTGYNFLGNGGPGACIASELADYITVINNTCYDSELGIDIGSGEGNVVAHNTITDCITGIATSSNRNSNIYNNIVSGATDEAFYSYTMSNGESHHDNKWYNNIVYNSWRPFYEFDRMNEGSSWNLEVYNNLFYDIDEPVHFGATDSLKFYHNTIHTNIGEDGLEIVDGSINAEVKNNIISISGGADPIYIDGSSTGSDVDYNCYHNRAGSATGPGDHSIIGDPLFADAAGNDFHLQSDSPAIDSGINIGISSDLDNNSRPVDGDNDGTAEVDIGAYEYILSDLPPTRANPFPNGTLDAGTTSTNISLTTDVQATCRYSTTPGTAYADMVGVFSITDSTAHSTTVTGLEDGNTYTYYVRCIDTEQNANTDDFPITFSIAEPLVLHGAPANQAIRLSWTVSTTLPATSTWQIAYDGPTGDQTSPITGIISPTRAYSLTSLTNYVWYTVTLNAMLDSTSFLSDTARMMPTGILVYLPLVLRDN